MASDLDVRQTAVQLIKEHGNYVAQLVAVKRAEEHK